MCSGFRSEGNRVIEESHNVFLALPEDTEHITLRGDVLFVVVGKACPPKRPLVLFRDKPMSGKT